MIWAGTRWRAARQISRAFRTTSLSTFSNVEEWTAAEPVQGVGLLSGTLGGAHIRKESLGVALVIGAWNFPILLTLQPIIAATAAGCCVIIKPWELASASDKQKEIDTTKSTMNKQPYDAKHAGKFAVTNKLGFRRGETLADQRVSGFKEGSCLWRTFLWLVLNPRYPFCQVGVAGLGGASWGRGAISKVWFVTGLH
ncbi:hypothetical protein PpBr36_03872 [Pyricularia pennisetigena]|uniref:hypothetical protein n=1 Tax=Pyricularia pennisetigena TaxID=1578925 RepID=UPI00115343CD|nr:hypothetical protein PpBr36_03872 [Pyricularia pennisetigena]TLS31023.1 hypothetical protein PpBr36_03872 [Pyricularia pennisetigena]